MSQKQKAKVEDIVDTTPDIDDIGSNSGNEDVVDPEEATAPSTSQKKKKKKKSKVSNALNAFRGRSDIPQELVDQVLDKVKAEGSVGSEAANAENVRQALEQIKIMDVVKGKAGIGGLNRKDMGEHKVSNLTILQNPCLLCLCSSGQRSQYLSSVNPRLI